MLSRSRSSNCEPRRRRLPLPLTSASRLRSPTSTARCHSPNCAHAAASAPPPSTSASPPLPPPAASASPTKVIASPVADRARATISREHSHNRRRHRAGCPPPLPDLSTAWRKRQREAHQDMSRSAACPARHPFVRSQPSFRPDLRARHAGARSGGQGWPVFGPPRQRREASLTVASTTAASIASGLRSPRPTIKPSKRRP